MADEQSTATDDSVDTSTNEETQDTEGSLEDIEVDPKDLEDTEETEESKDSESEEEDTEPADTKEESKEDEGTEESKEDTKEPELSDEEKQKQHNREMAEKRIQDKQQREKTIKEQQQEYVAQAEDEKDEAVRQLQVDAYNNKVEGNTNKLTNWYDKAVKEFDILASDDPVVKEEVDAAIDAFQAQYVTIDAYGNPVEVRGDLYQYLQRKADSISKLTGIRTENQKNSKNKEKSKVVTTPSKAPKEPKKDADLDAFDEEAKKP